MTEVGCGGDEVGELVGIDIAVGSLPLLMGGIEKQSGLSGKKAASHLSLLLIENVSLRGRRGHARSQATQPDQHWRCADDDDTLLPSPEFWRRPWAQPQPGKISISIQGCFGDGRLWDGV